ncbi:protein translocase subunit SecD [Patescibacteria group bacterium]|nr:protein translocase subunit SecD [Patescibacteria group bacterium]
MKQKYLIFIGILVLVFLAGTFVYPDYFDKGVDFLNTKVAFKIPHFWTRPFRLGLDLQGGVSLTYEADLSTIGDRNKTEVMAGLRDIIERRVNILGVTEPLVQVVGENRLLVELAGVKNVDEAIRMIGETPYLEFLEQRAEEETNTILDKIKELEEKNLEEMQKVEDWQIAFQNPYFKPTELTGKYLSKTTVIFDQTSYKPTIQLQFDDEGAELFEQITERNIKKPLAIFLDSMSIVDTNGDGKIDINDLYAPIVQDKISGGKAVITGDMSIQRANEIVKRLNSGALPVKIGEPISQTIVGPTLGKESLQKSLWAGLVGLLAVVVFIIIVYRGSGVVASLSLTIYIILILALFKLIPVTLTLAGIGGFILSIGMAVDANVLIFSRMKEELRDGKIFSQSITDGFKRAWPSIRDGNLTTIIVAFIFFFLGTSFIKGFALTLSIGIVISVFSAIVITRNLLRLFEGTRLERWRWLWA